MHCPSWAKRAAKSATGGEGHAELIINTKKVEGVNGTVITVSSTSLKGHHTGGAVRLQHLLSKRSMAVIHRRCEGPSRLSHVECERRCAGAEARCTDGKQVNTPLILRRARPYAPNMPRWDNRVLMLPRKANRETHHRGLKSLKS